MQFDNLLFHIDENIATITINRPSKLNALNAETFNELETVFDHCKTNENIFVVIITGKGEKAFVAGADINELSKCSKESGREFSEKGQTVFNLIENLGKPVIAAVNGFALGGGCELALACHIRVASENASFGQPEVNLGIIPGYGGTQRLARLINTGRASEYILTGDMINSKKALDIGLINSIHAQDELLPMTKKLAQKIASKGQIAVRLALNSIVSINNLDQSDGMNLEAELFGKCCGTNDFVEGTTAFLEKRKPNFENK
jgi:enoyl-CoA hydratase